MDSETQAALRSLPQVEELLSTPQLQSINGLTQKLVADAARDAIDTARQAILAGQLQAVSVDALAADACMRALSLQKPSLRRVINASGIIVHTNLGRSPLAKSAIDAVNDVIAGYSTLEYNTETMARGSRHSHCEQLICTLTGAEAALAVNNNAAAVMMVLNVFASEREAIVSRGEEVEIGGSFRIPDIMAASHARMVEVGATNKTHASDYEAALTPETSMLLKVHRSNFRQIGFTDEVSVEGLRAIADACDHPVLVYEDQGSGSLMHLDCFGAYAEPTVAASLKAGADIVSFSGDKLLGGPQAGIIAGRKELIDRLKASPLARALRLDKMTLAALEATLRLYLDPQEARTQLPTLRMLCESAEEVLHRAQYVAESLSSTLPRETCTIELAEEVSRAGGGALPMCDIPTWCVRVSFKRGNALDAQRHLVQRRPIPIVCRINHDTLLLDARTLLSRDERLECVEALKEYFSTIESA